jgi:hypothetical protein
MNAVTPCQPNQPFIVFMDTSSATAQELKLVDDEIKVLERVTQELKRQHNALVPISRLPPETLVGIFSLLPLPAGDSDCAPYLEWIYVTHVCRRWREIALHSPNLWTHINFTDLALAGITEIFSRAKMSPLRLEANIKYWKKPRFNAFRRQLEAHVSFFFFFFESVLLSGMGFLHSS